MGKAYVRLKRKHREVQKFECVVCKTEFNSKFELKQHQRELKLTRKSGKYEHDSV